MEKKIEIIEWTQSDEPPMCYRVDEPGAGNRLFQDIKNNAENDGREQFKLNFVTQEEWDEIEKRGKENA